MASISNITLPTPTPSTSSMCLPRFDPDTTVVPSIGTFLEEGATTTGLPPKATRFVDPDPALQEYMSRMDATARKSRHLTYLQRKATRLVHDFLVLSGQCSGCQNLQDSATYDAESHVRGLARSLFINATSIHGEDTRSIALLVHYICWEFRQHLKGSAIRRLFKKTLVGMVVEAFERSWLTDEYVSVDPQNGMHVFRSSSSSTGKSPAQMHYTINVAAFLADLAALYIIEPRVFNTLVERFDDYTDYSNVCMRSPRTSDLRCRALHTMLVKAGPIFTAEQRLSPNDTMAI
ncbi:hypothetical protein PLICRDRAFT_505795 [Plicaturopsis crispa FD-325 SS-3]|nr:hypothetical protein PLICRDRAFT_505795 [Plicaturopsis crispa FD-325 SS-3]